MGSEAASFVALDEGATVTIDKRKEQDEIFSWGTRTEGADGDEGNGGLDEAGLHQGDPFELEVRPVSISKCGSVAASLLTRRLLRRLAWQR